jgi:hypothetical protein
VFLINSRSASFVETLLAKGGPYPEVTAAVLPSSLTKFLSYALVFSTYPPVSVYGTDLHSLTKVAFSRHHVSLRWLHPEASPSPCGTCIIKTRVKFNDAQRLPNHAKCGNINPLFHRLRLSASP